MALPHMRNQSRLAAAPYPKYSCVRDKCLKQLDAKCSHTPRDVGVCVCPLARMDVDVTPPPHHHPPPTLSKEALRAQGLDGAWVVAVEVWLCDGAAAGQAELGPGLPALGPAWGVRGSGWAVVHTPDKASDSIIRLHL